MSNTKLELKYKNINTLGRWLLDVPLTSKLNKGRVDFIKILNPLSNILNQKIANIVSKYVSKDEDGKIKIDKLNRYVIDSEENNTNYLRDYKELLDNVFEIEVLVDNIDCIYVVKDILFSNSFSIMGEAAIQYDEWVESFSKLPDRININKEPINEKTKQSKNK